MTTRKQPQNPHTLSIDIGGTGIKTLIIDNKGNALSERQRELTPKPTKPKVVMAVVKKMIDAQQSFHRVSVGFPGVVKQGVVKTAPNLGTKDWAGFELEQAIADYTKKPVRTMNDAELQGYGVIKGKGVEIVLTLGTGLGTALYVNGHVMPNLELAHHPLRRGKTYEQLVGDKALARKGKKKWRKEVNHIIEILALIFNYDILHIGGGNAAKLKGPFPENVDLFENVEGLAGGIGLWQDDHYL